MLSATFLAAAIASMIGNMKHVMAGKQPEWIDLGIFAIILIHEAQGRRIWTLMTILEATFLRFYPLFGLKAPEPETLRNILTARLSANGLDKDRTLDNNIIGNGLDRKAESRSQWMVVMDNLAVALGALDKSRCILALNRVFLGTMEEMLRVQNGDLVPPVDPEVMGTHSRKLQTPVARAPVQKPAEDIPVIDLVDDDEEEDGAVEPVEIDLVELSDDEDDSSQPEPEPELEPEPMFFDADAIPVEFEELVETFATDWQIAEALEPEYQELYHEVPEYQLPEIGIHEEWFEEEELEDEVFEPENQDPEPVIQRRPRKWSFDAEPAAKRSCGISRKISLWEESEVKRGRGRPGKMEKPKRGRPSCGRKRNNAEILDMGLLRQADRRSILAFVDRHPDALQGDSEHTAEDIVRECELEANQVEAVKELLETMEIRRSSRIRKE